jgi:N-acetylglucosaminyldiphosphoundecaprenol N-acetyl-beta-D-mannosaminyltransferase
MMRTIAMQSFEEVNLGQTRFHKVTVDQLIEFIADCTQKDKKTIVGNVNVRAANLAYELP